MIPGCGGDSSDPTDVGSGGLDSVTLSVPGAASFGRVGIKGLPSSAKAGDPTRFEVTINAEGSVAFNLPIEQDQDGFYFYAPLHPVAPNDGGAIQIQVTDGSETSPEQQLDLAALPEAPGSFASLINTMREHLEQRAGWNGTTLAELKATAPADVSPIQLPFKLAQSYLDSEDDAHDLTDLVANTDGFLSAEDAELLDRLFGYFDLETILRDEITTFVNDATPAALKSASSGVGDKCFDVGPDISTAPELSVAMIRGAVHAFGADPNSDAGRILTNGGRAIATLGVVPGAGLVAGVAGVVIAEVQAASGAIAGLYPSRFVSIVFDVDRTVFPEDDPGFAKYSNVKVVAASDGWSADASIASVAVNAMGAYMSGTGTGLISGSEIYRDVSVMGLGEGAGAVFGDTDIIEFCSKKWTVDISSPLYCTAQSLSRKLDVDVQAQEARPKEVGSDFLRVAAQSAKFAGRKISGDVAVEVKQIIVDVTPDEIFVVKPGDTINVTGTIMNADLTTLLWTAQKGSWDDGLSDETNGGRSRILKTPTSTSDYPFLITVESMSRQGIRGSGEPPRLDIATVRYQPKQILVNPGGLCVRNGQSEPFEAVVPGNPDAEVTWTLENPSSGSGSINETTGVYRAPSSGEGEVTVVATLVGNTSIRGSVTVEYGDCSCMWEVTIEAGVSSAGGVAAHSFAGTTTADFFLSFTGFDGSSDDAGGLILIPGPGRDVTGEFAIDEMTFVSGTSFWGVGPDEEGTFGTLHVTSNTGGWMQGTFDGACVTYVENNRYIRVFSGRFRSAEGFLQSPECGP